MIRTRSRRRGEAQLLADLNDLLTPAPRSCLAGVAWRWRYEFALLVGVAVVVTVLLLVVGDAETVMIVSALLGAFGPPWHEAQTAFAWRVITPHRLRCGFSQARIQSRRGRLPLVLRTTSEPFGERARVWCPAGTSAEDLQSARALLRAACWAADVQIIPDQRHRHIVTIDVIRRGRMWHGRTALDPPAPDRAGLDAASPDSPTLPPASGTGAAAPAARCTPAPGP
jgi:hypothetical protein